MALSPTEISMAHTIDDLCIENARLRKGLSTVRWALSDVGHMIEHNQPQVAVEYVDRALSAADKALCGVQEKETLKSSGLQTEKENI